MNVIERLISEVEKRPLLWNRLDNDYSNRTAMDAEWEKISLLLAKDKDFVKQKWRNLRDQFIRESKKVKVPFDNPTKPYIYYYRGKWIYFSNMMFLKRSFDIIKKNSEKSFSPPEEIEIHDEDIKQEIIEFDEDDVFANAVNNYNNETDDYKSVTSPSPEDSYSSIPPKVDIIQDDLLENTDSQTQTTRKRKASEINETIEPEAKRPGTLPLEDQNEIDDDMHFVKSLVPFLRKLSPIRKLLVRNEIQSLLIRESLCDKCKLGTDNHG